MGCGARSISELGKEKRPKEFGPFKRSPGTGSIFTRRPNVLLVKFTLHFSVLQVKFT